MCSCSFDITSCRINKVFLNTFKIKDLKLIFILSSHELQEKKKRLLIVFFSKHFIYKNFSSVSYYIY